MGREATKGEGRGGKEARTTGVASYARKNIL